MRHIQKNLEIHRFKLSNILKMGKKFLVTGGTGFIGGALVRRLVKLGHSVRVLDNDSRGSSSRLSDILHQIEFVKADIRDASAVKAACKDIDICCHLAYVNGTEFFYSKPDLVLDVGVRGMMNILDGCIENHVPEFVLASSSEVYQTAPKIPTDETAPLVVPDPRNPRYSYGGGKIICELMAMNFGRKYFKKTKIFRPHNVYGPQMGWEHVLPQFILRMNELKNKNGNEFEFPIQGSGTETRAFIFVDDFTDGLIRIIDQGENLEIYHIGTMNEVSIRQVAEGVAKALRCKINVKPGALTEGSTLRRCPDITKLEGLGFNPQISLEDGLNRTAEWYVQNAHLRASS